MGKRGWRMIGRNDHEVIEPLPENTVKAIAELQVSLAEGMKTIFDVYRNNMFIGQVRTTFGGQFFREDPEDEFQFAAFKWSNLDQTHGHALAALLSCRQGDYDVYCNDNLSGLSLEKD
jgi:hypothetical protein